MDFKSRERPQGRANHLLSINEEDQADLVCFHAHAAVEKFLKAIIFSHTGDEPPYTHGLRVLLKKLDITDEERLENCKWLN